MVREDEKASRVVAVFGEMLVDEFPDRSVLGGAPFNVAYHLRRLGLAPVLFTRVGDDDAGARLRTALDAAGLDARGVQVDAERPTGRVLVVEADGAHRFDILADCAYDAVDADAVATLAASIDPRVV